jgi:twinkle protein
MFHQKSGWTYLKIMTRDIRTNNRCSDTAFSSTFSTLSSSQSRPLSTKSSFGDHYNKNRVPNIESYLEQQEFEYKTNESHCMLRVCPFCLRPTNNDPTNLYKLYIEKETGIFFCHRCGKSGSWQTFCGYVSGETEITSQTGILTSTKKSNVQHPLSMPDQLLHSFCITNLLDVPKSEATTSSSSIHPLDYLTNVRGLSRAVLRKYGVGTLKHYFRDNDNKSNKSESHSEDADKGKNGNNDKNDDTSGHSVDCISFPWLMTADEVIAQERSRGVTTDIPPGSKFWTRRIKIRSIENKSWQRLLPAGGGWGLFGYHTIPNDANEIVVTEGEYDAMAGMSCEFVVYIYIFCQFGCGI